MSAFGPRAGGLRVIRIVIVLVAFGTVLNSTGGVLLFTSNQTRAEDIRALTLQTRRDAEVTHEALCAFRGDLERRVRTSQAFLREHPAGIAGIPARTLRESIKNQVSTIDALSALDC